MGIETRLTIQSMYTKINHRLSLKSKWTKIIWCASWFFAILCFNELKSNTYQLKGHINLTTILLRGKISQYFRGSLSYLQYTGANS